MILISNNEVLTTFPTEKYDAIYVDVINCTTLQSPQPQRFKGSGMKHTTQHQFLPIHSIENSKIYHHTTTNQTDYREDEKDTQIIKHNPIYIKLPSSSSTKNNLIWKPNHTKEQQATIPSACPTHLPARTVQEENLQQKNKR